MGACVCAGAHLCTSIRVRVCPRVCAQRGAGRGGERGPVLQRVAPSLPRPLPSGSAPRSGSHFIEAAGAAPSPRPRPPPTPGVEAATPSRPWEEGSASPGSAPLRAPPRGHAAPLFPRYERCASPRHPPRSLSTSRGLRAAPRSSAPGGGTGLAEGEAAQESSAVLIDYPALLRPWGRGWRGRRPAAGWDWDTCCRLWCSPPWPSWGLAALAPRHKVRRGVDGEGPGKSPGTEAENANLCRGDFFSFKFRVYMCKQRVPPHAGPPPGCRGSGPSPPSRVCCCLAWSGQAFPCTPPSSGASRPEVEGLWAEGAPASSPPGRGSGAGVLRRAGKVRGKGRCEASVLLQRHSLALGLRR